MWPEHERHRAPVDDFPPPWASAWGDDRYGLWAELTVKGVTQRMRWIEPGTFLMGSLQDERDRIEDKDVRRWASEREGPRHAVTLSQGYWLADTPCTQALWLAVAGGKNPSRFVQGEDAPQRPVEQVSWDLIHEEFLPALGQLVDDAEAMLPTEAQWEYACRAGTRTAYWWGDAFEPARATVSQSGIHQFTTPVTAYARNPWGLYDMHGNVWEWCADARRPYADQPQVDPTGGTDGDARAQRGGAWNLVAAGARSAYRDEDHRGKDWHDFGFRFLLRSQAQLGGR